MKIGNGVLQKELSRCMCLVTDFMIILIATVTLLELNECSINIPFVAVLSYSNIYL